MIIVGASIVCELAYGTPWHDTALRWLEASLWGAGSTHPYALVQVERIGGIWYLLALFWARIFISIIHRLPDVAKVFITGAAMMIACVIGQVIWLPLSILSGIGCAFYLIIGMFFRKYGAFEKFNPILLCLAVVCWGHVVLFGGNSSIAMCVYPLGIWDVIGGIAGCYCIVWLCKGLDQLPMVTMDAVRWIGRNTLPIFCLHILEDNIIPWGNWGTLLSETTNHVPYGWIILVLSRLIVLTVLVVSVYHTPIIKSVYFPERSS